MPNANTFATSLTAVTSDSKEGDGFLLGSISWAPLADAATYVLTGAALDEGGCIYEYPAKDRTHVGLWELRVLGIDPHACRQLIEEGVPTKRETQPEGEGYAFSQAGAGQSATDSLSSSALVASGTRTVFLDVTWLDPIGIAVNSDETDLTWSWNGSCVSNGSVVGRWNWFWPDGWSRESWFVNQLHYCSYWRGSSGSVFKNSIFCAGQTTWAYYDWVRVAGWYDGTYTPTWSSHVAGGCTSLLHMRVQYGVLG
jgi:hypothetical protein